jgi:aerobic-type carbon monoxide dehydrogenase small subunit (CoxS/CutS family)
VKVELELNGRATAWDIAPGANLLSVLREMGQFSVKLGCETGDCGSCTVLLEGEPVNACVVAAARAHGQRVTTLEGLLGDPLMQSLQREFVAKAGVQCGYCTPGMLISLYAHFKSGGGGDDPELREALTGNLCRCTGYVKPLEAAAAVATDTEQGGAS